jgi:hypothetical protein
MFANVSAPPPALLVAKLKSVAQETAIKTLIAKGYFAVFPSVGNLLYLTARDRHAAYSYRSQFNF